MDIDLSEITVLLGQKNSGKSVLTENLLTQTERFICLDPKGEHGPPGAVFPQSPAECLKLWMEGHTRQVIRDHPLKKGKAVQYARAFGQLERCYFYVDEAHNYMDSHGAPQEFIDLARWHVSHSNCGMVFGAHQAKHIYDAIWSQTDNYIIFSYGDHQDAKLSRLSMPSKYKQLVHKLDPNSYQYVYFKDVAGSQPEVRGPCRIPEHLT